MKPITGATVQAIHRNLREFGYSTLTLDEVKTAVETARKGEPDAIDIIARFAHRMLVENGYLAGEEAQ